MTAKEAIQILEVAKAECTNAKWIPQDHNKSNGLVTTCVYYLPVCSECGGTGDLEDKYCKHCGANMRGEQDEIDNGYQSD